MALLRNDGPFFFSLSLLSLLSLLRVLVTESGFALVCHLLNFFWLSDGRILSPGWLASFVLNVIQIDKFVGVPVSRNRRAPEISFIPRPKLNGIRVMHV